MNLNPFAGKKTQDDIIKDIEKKVINIEDNKRHIEKSMRNVLSELIEISVKTEEYWLKAPNSRDNPDQAKKIWEKLDPAKIKTELKEHRERMQKELNDFIASPISWNHGWENDRRKEAFLDISDSSKTALLAAKIDVSQTQKKLAELWSYAHILHNLQKQEIAEAKKLYEDLLREQQGITLAA